NPSPPRIRASRRTSRMIPMNCFLLLCDRHQVGIRLPGNQRSTPVHGFRLLPASLTFSPACLTLPAAWSAWPSASRRSLPTALPAASLALPLSSWALFLVLSVSLTAVPSLVVLRTRPLCPLRAGLTRLARPARVVHRGKGREPGGGGAGYC